MKILYISRKGNMLRLYLGKHTKEYGWTNPNYRDWNNNTYEPSEDYCGDDWDDAPYEHNCGTIYPEFVYKTVDLAVPYDWEVIEPCTDVMNSRYCMDDFIGHTRPFYILLPKQVALYQIFEDRYEDVVGISDDKVVKIYLEDSYSDVIKKIKDFKKKELNKDE